jgi:hypothetical protein
MPFGVGEHRHAQAVFLAQHRIGVHVDLVEGDAAAGELRRQVLAKMAAAASVKDERLNPSQ